MKVVTLVGARPQFIKASMVSRAFSAAGIEEMIVHSGQHYDRQVSQIFFDELEIPQPEVNLQVGSGSHAVQTGEIMERFETFLLAQDAVDWVLVYGDTNTTLAGALVAAKLDIPISHVEAGLRSFNRKMPEEINRIVTDRLSEVLFCPTSTAMQHLKNEGIDTTVCFSGDVMYDATIHFSALAATKQNLIDDVPADYYLATVHRASNTDNKKHLLEILAGLGALPAPVLLPLHPRTKAKLDGIDVPQNIHVKEPVGYLKMLQLIKNAQAVLTDSGGLQKEAYWLKKACITLRQETEWVETLEGGWNQLVAADRQAIQEAVARVPALTTPQKMFGLPLDGGTASNVIAKTLLGYNS
ncbi:MAG: UDP-N-acetylglucosamine 2-epimerase (non-hydrolyzing) [Bacteroidota bacterium]